MAAEAPISKPVDLFDLSQAEKTLEAFARLASPVAGARPNSARPDVAARYKALVDQIPAVIFMAFLDEGISEAYVSPHIERVLGFTQAEWLQDPVRWYQHIHPDDRGRWNVEAAGLVLSGEPVHSVYRVIARDGHTVWFQCDVRMVTSDDGRPWFLHGTAFEITQLKQAQQALERAHAELELRVRERTAELARVNADLEQFAYSASHDLQEPLRNIALYSEWLKRNYAGKLDQEGESFVGLLHENAHRMMQLIQDLLAYTRAAQPSEQIREVIDANTVFEASVESVRALIQETGATVTHDPLPAVSMLHVHLHQIFQNLVANAIKYRSEAPPLVHVWAEPSEDEWIFSARDNGVGIAPQYREKVFGLFKRLHSGGSYSGTGIGLALCKRIVERYGGRIWVESGPAGGSIFRWTIPRNADAA